MLIGTHTSPTTMICADLAIGWQTGFDLTLAIRPIGDSAQMERTVNSAALNLADPLFRLLSVRISSGEGEQLPPSLENMFPGDTLSLVPPKSAVMSASIAVGGTTRTLLRTPYAGSIRCIDPSNNSVAFTVVGKVVTLTAAATTPVRIYYLPVLSLTVFEPFDLSYRTSQATVAWNIYTEETGGVA